MMRILLSLMLALSASVPLFALEVGEDELQSCFNKIDRLERLNCYDRLLKFPQKVEQVSGASTAPNQPQDVNFAWGMLIDAEKIEDGVSIALVDNATDILATGFEKPLEIYLATRTKDEIKEIGRNFDFYAALPSEADIGEKAVLLLSCQNNISNFDIIWDRPFVEGFQNVTYFSSDVTAGTTAKLSKKYRITSNGFKLQSPRGIEGIKLINNVLTRDNLQITMPYEDTTVSTFFRTDGLQPAIALLSRHCSWVQ